MQILKTKIEDKKMIKDDDVLKNFKRLIDVCLKTQNNHDPKKEIND